MKHKIFQSAAGLRTYFRLNYLGLVVAVVSFCVSFLPSLMPRPWLYQGFIGGASLAIGYGIGSLLSFLVRLFWRPTLSQKQRTYAWRGLAGVALVLVAVFLYLGDKWQNQVLHLLGESPLKSFDFVRIIVLALLFGLLFLSIGRGIRKLNRLLVNLIDKLLLEESV